MKKENEINLSIIIPHYNSPKLLANLIESIPDKKDIQIVVIDDNSDEQIEALNTLKSEYQGKVEFYSNYKQVKGAGACRNIGLEHAKGNWLLFADADDFFMEGMYQEVSKFFDTDFDIVFFSPISINLDDGSISHRHEILVQQITNYMDKPTRENLLELKSNPGNPPWSKLIKRDLVFKNQIQFEEVLHANDIMFSAKIGYYSKKIEVSCATIYCVTRSKGSLTTYKNMESFDVRMNEYIKVCCFLKEKYCPKEFRALHTTGIGTLYRAIREGYGVAKYISIIKEFKKSGIPIITIETFKGGHFLKKIRSKEREKRLDEGYIVK